MAGGGRLRKRVEVDSSPALKRARNGSAFTKCEECSKDVAVALISFHDCSLDAKIKTNLEAQVVEMANEKKAKPAVAKKKTNKTEPKVNKEKKAKNSNGKKRPLTAFFLFMTDFRKSFKEANPDCKSVATVAKEGGEKWKSMSDEEKKIYIDRAAELKAESEKALESNDPEDEQDVNDSTEKETKEELEDDLSGEEVKEIKNELEDTKEEQEDDISGEEVKEIKNELEDDLSDEEVKEVKEEEDNLTGEKVKEENDDLLDEEVKEEAEADAETDNE